MLSVLTPFVHVIAWAYLLVLFVPAAAFRSPHTLGIGLGLAYCGVLEGFLLLLSHQPWLVPWLGVHVAVATAVLWIVFRNLLVGLLSGRGTPR